jgi:hypothetical protein
MEQNSQKSSTKQCDKKYQNKERKYNSEFRKKLLTKFDKLKDKTDFLDIYNIIIEDIGTNFSSNRNGIFINMNILSNECIDKLLEFMSDKFNTSITQSEMEKVTYKTYKLDDVDIISDVSHKLSNQDKNIIKRIRNKVTS